MNKLIKNEHISEVMLGGDPAGEFNPETLVYGEYAVRIMIYNALNHFTDRHLTSAMHSDSEGCAVLENVEYDLEYVDSETIKLNRCRNEKNT